MRVIDLLNKIANSEEVPEKIEYLGKEFSFQHNCNEYINDFGTCLIKYITGKKLNDCVKIIEDTPEDHKKIEKLNLIFEDKFIKENFESGGISYLDTYTTLKMIYNKQCEMIDHIKEMEAK